MTTDDLDAALERALTAWGSDDPDQIRAAVDELDRLDTLERAKPKPTLLGSALWYASMGLHVFALTPGAKIPRRGTNGCLDATTDTDTIRAWWGETPDANVGIATGYVVDVVDIDGPAGQKSRCENWDDVFGIVDAINLGKVSTPRPGGMHVYVPHVATGNLGGALEGIDYRGHGGYVVAPPSVITDGPHPGRYEWLGRPRFAARPTTHSQGG